MLSSVLFLLLSVSFYIGSLRADITVNGFTFPKCVQPKDMIYYANTVSIQEALRTCLTFVKDAALIPGYVTGEVSNVSAQIYINNLIGIDEISNTATIDFFMTLRWKDYRLHMPDVFNAYAKQTKGKFGSNAPIDITSALTSSENPVPSAIWRPSIAFPEAIDITETDYYYRLYNTSEILYLTHRIGTFVQTSFDYKEYPYDTQTITFRFFGFSFPKTLLMFVPEKNTSAKYPGIDFW